MTAEEHPEVPFSDVELDGSLPNEGRLAEAPQGREQALEVGGWVQTRSLIFETKLRTIAQPER
jgi:hypothetical protein